MNFAEKKVFNLFLISVLCIINVYGQKSVPVFVSGQEGYSHYRIPAIIGLPNGKLLAFAEGRVNSESDYGDVNIVMKTSLDKGKTWSEVKTIVDYGTLQAGNPAPVVDLLDPNYPKGRIFLFYNTGNANEKDLRAGKGIRETWYITSTDGGETWSEGVNITIQVHKPYKPDFNPLYNFKEDWRISANTPGHALQITRGKFKGRIYVAGYHSEGGPKQNAEEYFAHGFYSDDHGKTFKLSENIPFPGSNESTAAEISNNGVVMNSRNERRNVKARIMSYSNDGGHSWDTTYFDLKLIDPIVQGSILNIGFKKGKAILAFSNPAHPTKRDNLTLKVSLDEGKNWSIEKVIDSKLHIDTRYNAAYSDLVKINNRKIGVLYEKDHYARILFTVVNWKEK